MTTDDTTAAAVKAAAERDARFAATDAMLDHMMSPGGTVCSCGHTYRRDRIGGHVPFAQIASHYAEAAVTAAAPILLAPVEAPSVTRYTGAGVAQEEAADPDGFGFAWIKADDVRAAFTALSRERDALRRERDEAVAANSRRIAAACRAIAEEYEVRADQAVAEGRDDHAHQCEDMAECYNDAARIAEGETSTTRDADPGGAQDARRGDGYDWQAVDYTAGLIRARDEAQERIAAALALHQPMRIYDECDHPHQDGEPGVVDTGEFLTCEEEYLYSICRRCCVENLDWPEQAEWCAEKHDHARDGYCATVRALTDTGDDATGTEDAT